MQMDEAVTANLDSWTEDPAGNREGFVQLRRTLAVQPGVQLEWVARPGVTYSLRGTDPARIMMVGDSEHDFEVARALGVRCVLFSGGHQPREVLAATGAPVIDALAQLLPLRAQLAAE